MHFDLGFPSFGAGLGVSESQARKVKAIDARSRYLLSRLLPPADQQADIMGQCLSQAKSMANEAQSKMGQGGTGTGTGAAGQTGTGAGNAGTAGAGGQGAMGGQTAGTGQQGMEQKFEGMAENAMEQKMGMGGAGGAGAQGAGAGAPATGAGQAGQGASPAQGGEQSDVQHTVDAATENAVKVAEQNRAAASETLSDVKKQISQDQA